MTGEIIEQWAAWGFARHSNFMRPAGVAQAIWPSSAYPVASMPPSSSCNRSAHRAANRTNREAMMAIDTGYGSPPRVSGGEEDNGHLEELRVDPIALMNRVRSECGDVGVFRLAHRDVVLLTGAGANEFFFRAPEEVLDQAEAYPFMTPVFGEGVVFDAPPERRREMLHNQALRDKFMRGHAATIAAEVEQMVAGWDDEGEIDLLDWFAELTIYTSSACLIGKRFRGELDKRFAELYHDLEQGTDAIAYVDPYAPIESFRRRDAAREGLVRLVEGIMERRAAGPPSGDDERDLLDVLMSITNEDGSPRFLADEVTGMFISMMFAGHHTTSGTAAWTLIELLRHPEELASVETELGELYATGPRSATRPCGPCPTSSPPSKRPSVSTLRSSCCSGWPRKISRSRGTPSRPARWSGPARRCPTASPKTSPTPTRSSRPATSSPRGGPDQSLDLDPLRGGPAPVRRGGLRHDAAQGHLLRAAAGLGVRAGPAVGHLPERPFEDGGPAPAALRGALPAQGPQRGRRLMRVVVDLDLCQGHGVCESEAPDRVRTGQTRDSGRPGPSPGEDRFGPRSKRRSATARPPALSIVEEE